MGKLTDIVRAFCRFSRKNINWQNSKGEDVKATIAYNEGVNDVIDFLNRYEAGRVDAEHIEHILKNYK